MNKTSSVISSLAAIIILLFSIPTFSQTVKITPVGSHDGEFCGRDRAMLFEDPDGTRILFDVGLTIACPNDPRLGKIDVVLLSGVHGDHIGDKRISKTGNSTCAKPMTEITTTPNTNTAEIIAVKKARAFVGGEMHKVLQKKVVNAGGSNTHPTKWSHYGV